MTFRDVSATRDEAPRGVHLRLVLLGLGTAALATSMILSSAQSASAAGSIEVSSDGTSYSSNYAGALFNSQMAMVPGDSQSKTFYVRNSGNEDGVLRITMEDVSADDIDFAGALSLSVSTATQTGTAATLSKATPCWELFEGQRVAPGQSVAVTARVVLGNLDGQAGQGATAGMTMRASLSAPQATPLAATACSTGPRSDVVALAPGGRTTRSLSTLATPHGAAGVTAATVPEATSQLPTLAVPGGVTLDPNTWHLYQELLVLLMVLALVLGSGSYFVVAWLRRRRSTGTSGA